LYVNRCYEGLALKNGNAELCDHVVPGVLANMTREKCILRVAAETQDNTLCVRLSDDYGDRKWCFKLTETPNPCGIGEGMTYDPAETSSCTCTDERKEYKASAPIPGCVCRPAYPIHVVTRRTEGCYTPGEVIENGWPAATCKQDIPYEVVAANPAAFEACVRALIKTASDCRWLDDVAEQESCFLDRVKSKTECVEATATLLISEPLYDKCIQKVS